MRDVYGLVPDHVRAGIEQEETLERHTGAARALRAALKAFDPHLSVVWVKDMPEEVRPMGTVSGRWHVERKNPGVLPSYFPITTPDGGYREPDFGVYEEIKRRDMWTADGLVKALARRDKENARREKDKALKSEQRKDEIAADLRAGWRVAGDGGIAARKWGKK